MYYADDAHVNGMEQTRMLQEVAHEARSSLAVIQLTAETLLARTSDGAERADLELILKQVDRLADIMEELARLEQ